MQVDDSIYNRRKTENTFAPSPKTMRALNIEFLNYCHGRILFKAQKPAVILHKYLEFGD